MKSSVKGRGGANVKHICAFYFHLPRNILLWIGMIQFIHILKPPKFQNHIFKMPLVFLWRTISWVAWGHGKMDSVLWKYYKCSCLPSNNVINLGKCPMIVSTWLTTIVYANSSTNMILIRFSVTLTKLALTR